MTDFSSDEEAFLGFNDSSVNETMLPACQPQQPMSSKMADKYDEQAQLARKSNEQTKIAGKKAQRDAILRCIERIDNFAARANGITQEQATTRLNRLEKCWMEFEAIANELQLSRGLVVVDSVVNPPNFRTIGPVSSNKMNWPCLRLAHLFQTC